MAFKASPPPTKESKIPLIIGILSLVLGTVIPLLIYFLSITKKEITFSVEKSISLIEPTKMQDNRVKVFYDSIQVANIYRIDCKLLNSGNKAITEKDYAETINLKIKNNHSFIRYEITENSKNANVDIKIQNGIIEIKPDLLNAGEFVNIAIYYTGKDINVISKANSRIIDGNFVVLDNTKKVKEKNKFYINLSPLSEKIAIYICLTYLLVFIVVVIFVALKSDRNSWFIKILTYIVMTFGFILCFIYIIINEFF